MVNKTGRDLRKSSAVSLQVLLTLVFSLIIIIVLIGCSLIIVSAYSEHLLDASVKQNLNFASQLSYSISSAIINFEADIKLLCEIEEIQRLITIIRPATEDDNQHFQQAVDELLSYNRTMYYNLSGIILYTTKGNYFIYGYGSLPETDIFHSEYYSRGLKHPANLVWLGYNQSTLKYEAVKIIYNREYRITGLLLLFFDKNYFKNTVVRSLYPEVADVYLLSELGQIQYSNNQDSMGNIFSQDLLIQMTKNEGNFYYGNKLILYREVGGSVNSALIPQWKVVLMDTHRSITRELDIIRGQVFAIITGVLIIVIIVIAIMMHRIVMPLNNLTVSMQNLVSSGRFIATPYAKYSFYREANILIKTYNFMIEEINRLINDIMFEKKTRLNMQQKVLENQLTPHFLFNALQIVSLQAYEAEAQQVCETLTNLSYILTEKLRETGTFTTVDNEIKYIRAYVAIIKAKYEDKIEFVFNIDDSLRDFEIPKFMLQPIIENSISHGVIPKIGKGTIQLRVLRDNNKAIFIISDDGVGMNATQWDKIKNKANIENTAPVDDGEHIGLVNINIRLRILYQNNYSFDLRSERFSGTIITIRLPL